MSDKQKLIHLNRYAANFTVLPNELLRNSSISFKARGLLAMMLSLPETWESRVGWIEEQTTEGREAIRSAIAELEAAGYCKKSRRRSEGGEFATYVWEWFGEPQNRTADGNPSPVENTADGNPSPVNRQRETADGNPSPNKNVQQEKPKRKKRAPLSEEDWMKALSENKAFEGLDIEKEKGKCAAWCQMKGRQLSRARFLNWLGIASKDQSNLTLKNETKNTARTDSANPQGRYAKKPVSGSMAA